MENLCFVRSNHLEDLQNSLDINDRTLCADTLRINVFLSYEEISVSRAITTLFAKRPSPAIRAALYFLCTNNLRCLFNFAYTQNVISLHGSNSVFIRCGEKTSYFIKIQSR